MATYSVTLPINGKMFVEVEADSDEEAIDKALESELTIDLIEEWEALRIVCQGNCFRGCCNEAYAEEM
jgi:hypothetical protein